MDLSTFLYFLVASVLLTIAPGPDIMYLLAKSLADGARSGIALAFGLCTGLIFHTTLVIIGVAAVIQQSPTAFAVLKYAGAAYLLYLIEFRLSRTFLKIFLSCPAVWPALFRRLVAVVTAYLFYLIQSALSSTFLRFSVALRQILSKQSAGN